MLQRPVPDPIIQNARGPQVGVRYGKVLSRVPIGTHMGSGRLGCTQWVYRNFDQKQRTTAVDIQYIRKYYKQNPLIPLVSADDGPSLTWDCEGPRRRPPTFDPGIWISGKFPIQRCAVRLEQSKIETKKIGSAQDYSNPQGFDWYYDYQE